MSWPKALPEVIWTRCRKLGRNEACCRRRLREDARRPFDVARDRLCLRCHVYRRDGTAARRAASDAPYRLRRLVDGRDAARMGGLLRSSLRRTGPMGCRRCQCSTATSPSGNADRLAGAALQRELAYWEQQLQGAPAVLELPAGPCPAFDPGFRRRSLPADDRCADTVGRRLRKLAADHQATPFMVLLAGYAALLSHHTRRARPADRHGGCQPHFA